MTRDDPRPTILVICDYYLPGYKSGGSLRTLVNMVDRLGDRYDFRIVTRCHDGRLDRTPYKSVRIGAWNTVGKADVYYLPKSGVRPGSIKGLIENIDPDAIYLKGFFATPAVFVLVLRRLGLIEKLPVVLAPEGEFAPGALLISSRKKRLYQAFARAAGLERGIVWKASAEPERDDIARFVGEDAEVFVAPDMVPKTIFPEFALALKPKKIPGAVRLAFLSRFVRKKNFDWLLHHISAIRGELVIDIYGPLEEADYWDECSSLIAELPENIKVEAKGPIPHEKVVETLVDYHFFILPTLGENFGHIFLEALAAGCPLIIADTTPWRHLKAMGIGWDLPLGDPAEWIGVIDNCLGMDQQEYLEYSDRARQFVVEWLGDRKLEEANERVLERALSAKC